MLTVDENREDHYSLNEPRTLELECDVQLAASLFRAHRSIRDVGLIVQYGVCYYSPHDGYDECPLRCIEERDGVIIGHGEGDFALAPVVRVGEAE